MKHPMFTGETNTEGESSLISIGIARNQSCRFRCLGHSHLTKKVIADFHSEIYGIECARSILVNPKRLKRFMQGFRLH